MGEIENKKEEPNTSNWMAEIFRLGRESKTNIDAMYKEIQFTFKDMNSLKVWKKICHTNTNLKSILISKYISEQGMIPRKRGSFIMITGAIHQKNIITLNVMLLIT